MQVTKTLGTSVTGSLNTSAIVRYTGRMIHHKAAMLTIALLLTIAPRANAQTYDWEIVHSETGYVDDTDTVKSSRQVITHMNMAIEPESDHRLRVTIHSLDITMPDTSIGTLHYDSTEPASDDLDAGSARLAKAFAPLVGLTFTLTYDPDEQIIIASEELTKINGLGVLGQSISPPYLTIPFAPFMLAADLQDDQAEMVADSQIRFSLIPNVGGFDTKAMDLDYKLEHAKPLVSASLSFEGEGSALFQGLSMDAGITVSAQSDASIYSGTQQVKEHTYSIAQSLRTNEVSARKFHSDFITHTVIRRVEQDSPHPTEAVESE